MISAIILAAGESKRMGKNKLLLEIGGRKIIDIVIDTLRDVADDIIVVLGHKPESLATLLKEKNVRWKINKNYRRGMVSTFQEGLKETSTSEAVFLILGDQPFIRKDFLLRMVEAWRKRKGKIISPIHKGKKGHPVLFDKAVYPEILSLGANNTIRDVIHRFDKDLYLLEAGEWSVLDIDSLEDFTKHKRNVI